MPDYLYRHWPIPFGTQVEFAQRLSVLLHFRRDPPSEVLARCHRTVSDLGRCVIDQRSAGIDFIFRTVFSCDAALSSSEPLLLQLFSSRSSAWLSKQFRNFIAYEASAVLTAHCSACLMNVSAT